MIQEACAHGVDKSWIPVSWEDGKGQEDVAGLGGSGAFPLLFITLPPLVPSTPEPELEDAPLAGDCLGSGCSIPGPTISEHPTCIHGMPRCPGIQQENWAFPINVFEIVRSITCKHVIKEELLIIIIINIIFKNILITINYNNFKYIYKV